MDIDNIKNLLSGEKISQFNNYKVMETLVADILRVYTLSGVSRGYDAEQLKNEVAIISSELQRDLTAESKFADLRLCEVGYALSCGLRGEFEVKTYGINYQTFYKWIEAYAYSQERTDAVNSIVRQKELKQLNTKTEPTLEEQRRMIISHINESYQTYKSKTKGLDLHISGRLGEVPDWGGVKDRFLTSEGLKPAKMTLQEYFENCIRENKDFIIEK